MGGGENVGLAPLLVFERPEVAGQVELTDHQTMQTEVLLVAPPRGPPVGLLVDPFGVKRYEDHVPPIGFVPMPHHALGVHSGIFLPAVGVLEDSSS